MVSLRSASGVTDHAPVDIRTAITGRSISISSPLPRAGRTILAMTSEALQELCETGQSLLMETRYLQAEAALVRAEKEAWANQDWETLSRLYMPLQEARRQRRQRCGEGIVTLDLLAAGPDDHIEGRRVVENYPHGQLLVAGWGTIEPAQLVRRLQAEHELYVETFLAAVYPVGGRRAVVIVPTEDVALPEPVEQSIDQLLERVPIHSIVLHEDQLPKGSRRGDTHTYAETMALWERLHTPFVAAADALPDPVARIEGYRRAIRVDYASELAHQKLSDVARELGRRAKATGAR